ncbi:hypothetical protein AB4277_22985 [Vibrio splendidus]
MKNMINSVRETFDFLSAHEWNLIDSSHGTTYHKRLVDCCNEVEQLVSTLNQQQAGERFLNNLKLVLNGSKSKHFFEHIVYPELDHIVYLIQNDSITHGGVREGAGRKVKRPTKQIRIDEDLAESFKMMSDYYQSLDDDGRSDFDNRFSTSGLLFPNG